MRISPIPPSARTPAQRPLSESIRAGVSGKYDRVTTMREDASLPGPWNTWRHQPNVGEAFWRATQSMTRFATLSDAVRQVVILVVGMPCRTAYGIYARATVLNEGNA